MTARLRLRLRLWWLRRRERHIQNAILKAEGQIHYFAFVLELLRERSRQIEAKLMLLERVQPKKGGKCVPSNC
jgi:hypothetical protein